MTLREVLHAHVPNLTAQSTFRDAIDKMDVYQFPALIIVNEDRSPIAVITEGDVSRAAQEQGSLLRLSELPALQFASKEPKTAGPDMEISDALHMMQSQGLKVLPVVDDSLFIGMVLRVDLMQAMLMDAVEPA
jgi:CBS domain-containing protein